MGRRPYSGVPQNTPEFDPKQTPQSVHPPAQINTPVEQTSRTRTRIVPGAPLVPDSIRSRSRRASRAQKNSSSSWSLASIGSPDNPVSFRELLSQPVSNAAAQFVTGPKDDDRLDLSIRAVSMAVGEVPEPNEKYAIPYIARRHSSYYTGYEIELIMESIRDPYHARQVLARIVAFPRWVRCSIAVLSALAGAAVSALNGFLSLVAFFSLMTVVLMYTFSFANRIGAGRFYDPSAYKVVWLGAFLPIGLLSGIILARSFVGQPWLALISIVGIFLMSYGWVTWVQRFQIKRFLSTEIADV